MDWSKCIICGRSEGDLKCPVDSNQKNGMQVYNNFLDAVCEFAKIEALPATVQFDKDIIGGEALFENRAKWHKSCHLKFRTTKL